VTQSGLEGLYSVAALVVRLVKAIRCNRFISTGVDKDEQAQEYMAIITSLHGNYADIAASTVHLEGEGDRDREEKEEEKETVLDLCLLLQYALQSQSLDTSMDLSMLYWCQVLLLSARQECLYTLLCEEVRITMAELAIGGKIGEQVVNGTNITALQRLECLFKDKDMSRLTYNAVAMEKYEQLCHNTTEHGDTLQRDFSILCTDNIMLVSAQQSISLLLEGFTALSARDLDALRSVMDGYLPRHNSNGVDFYYTLMYTQCVDAIDIMSRSEYICEAAVAYPTSILSTAHHESGSSDVVDINDDGSDGEEGEEGKQEEGRLYCLWQQSFPLLHAIHQEYLFEQICATFTTLVSDSSDGN
jgi:hypothetical protein